MKTIKHIKELSASLKEYKAKGRKIGFVPTMGALHKGHLSLIERCAKENDIIVVSIFVNPTQFNDKNDLKNYPRTLEKDLALMEPFKVDFVFNPEVEEMYPEPDTRVFEFGELGNVMEGKHRPGHFNGVAQVVTKLFDIVKPDKAYFGEKDFQQLAIIKHFVKTLNIPVEIIGCPILRETDGLAMSSRNMLLSEKHRKSAPLIFKTLQKAKQLKEIHDIDETINMVISDINACPELEVEYFEIVNDLTLQPVKSWKDNCNKAGCIAVKAGQIRLIDNIRF